MMEHIAIFFNELTLVELVLGAAFLLLFLVQICFYFFLYSKPYRLSKKNKSQTVDTESLPSISVVIVSKNDSDQLSKNLPFVLEQDYPNFEVVVVNSGSSDDTDIVLKGAENKYKNIYHTFIPNDADSVNEKKLALTVGIKASKKDYILFTEPYNKPNSKNWLMEFGKQIAKGNEIVLGYSGLVFLKRFFLRRFVAFDNMFLQVQFLSMAIFKKPYMGLGQNMAIRKDIFFENKGFSSILNIDGGEDDIYINNIAKGRKTGVVIAQDGMVTTDSINSFKSWRSFRSKYLYTKKFYRGLGKEVVKIEALSKNLYNIVLILLVALSIISSNVVLLVSTLSIFLLRFLVMLIVLNKNSKLFKAGSFHIDVMFFDFFLPVNNCFFRQYAKSRTRMRH
ncbi:MAG: glycosyltransferase [Fermentimonas sp.]|jgi:glycosyltransferase involved in cell wall biosynthesis